MRQLPLLLTPRAAARACFFDLAGGKRRAKFSALTQGLPADGAPAESAACP